MGYCAYHSIQNVIKLDENVRVANDSQSEFRNLLLRLRNGNSTLDDWNILNSRSTIGTDISNLGTKYIYLAYSNKVVNEYNLTFLKQSRESIYPIKAKHSSVKAAKLSSDQFGGLESLIHLAVNARVMLTRNLWVQKGLCNGSMGTVSQIIYKEGDTPPSLPIAVMVKLDSYNGPTFEDTGFIPIVPVLSSTDDNLERIQIPLRLSWAITSHRD